MIYHSQKVLAQYFVSSELLSVKDRSVVIGEEVINRGLEIITTILHLIRHELVGTLRTQSEPRQQSFKFHLNREIISHFCGHITIDHKTVAIVRNSQVMQSNGKFILTSSGIDFGVLECFLYLLLSHSSPRFFKIPKALSR